ncbi:MAG: LacI family DNA-binding transcriptional regulator [Lactobacillus sp.]|nr:LacI family DNA-binding transcriptional regulator [Lactobacillus sp.]
MVTLSDVAKAANVSKMTVSRVINHPELVAPELQELVKKAMDELNYRPNSVARALVNNRTNVVKFVTLEDIDTTEPYYMNLLFGVAQGLTSKQYAIQLVTDLSQIDATPDDGLIITGARHSDYPELKKIKKPFILFGENHENIDFVDNDNEYGTRVASEYALKQGYENIVFIGLNVKEPFEYSREAGYMSVVQSNLLTPQIYRTTNHSSASKQLVLDQWDEIKPNTCFICASDRIALGVSLAIREKGMKLPEEYGVIGYDGVFLDQVAHPKLTTVKQDIFEMGQLLAEKLLHKIDQHGQNIGSCMIKPKLIIRNSTK